MKLAATSEQCCRTLMFGPRTPEKIDKAKGAMKPRIREFEARQRRERYGPDRSNSTWRYCRWAHHCVVVTGFLVWNSRQRNERLAIGLFIAGAVIVVVLVVVVA